MALPSPDSSTVALLTDVGNDNGTLRDEFISGLVQGSAWTFGGVPQVLTYSLNINEDYESYPPGPPEPGPGGEWNDHPGMAAAVANALATWASVADITIEQIVVPADQYYFESGADLAITLSGDDLDRIFGGRVAGAAFFPDADYVEEAVYSDEVDRTTWPAPEGDVFLDNFEEHFDYLDPGGAGFTVILHELAHALGLKHPHDDGGSEGRPTFGDLGIEAMDSMRYTIMSYDIVAPAPGARGFAATPMPLDILAIQHIYGANHTYATGDNTYDLANASFRTIWDAGGTDVLTAASWSQPGGVVIDLREGEFSGRALGPKRMAIAYDVTIENAIGSDGADQLYGNRADNELRGRAGDDALSGRQGDDTLRGGTGADRMHGQGGDDILFFSRVDTRLDGGSGFDTLKLRGGLDLRLMRLTSKVADIECLDMRDGSDNLLTLNAQAVLDISSIDTLQVLGDAGDAVAIRGDYEDLGASGSFHAYRVGSAILMLDGDITVA
jgi:Ca2+-binding RTX toxin-like protein